MWIWADGDRNGGNSVEFRKRFSLPTAVQRVRLKCAADFCRVEIVIDGVIRLNIDAYAPLVDRQFDLQLAAGEHVVALRCRGTLGPSAVAMGLSFIGADSVPDVLTSGQWENAVESGTIASELWGVDARPARINPFDDYEQWKDALDGESGVQLPKFLAPDGFEVDRIRSATSDEGSWVSLAFDNHGRLIVAREDKGLLRMELDVDGNSITAVETINDSLKECRGLAMRDGDLFVNANNSKGIYRLRDTNGDGSFDDETLLREFPGGVGHGRNDLASGGRWLYSIHGDSVDLPNNNIVDRTSPFRAARRGKKSLEGALLRTTPDGETWELVCAGLRNPFGVAIHPQHGEPFTYDADAEFDMGAPWYRPTRVVHLVSGADYGWRGVTGAWPPYFPDQAENAAAVCNIGKGSPTAVKFGTNSNFPKRYRRALFILDWTYGRIIAVHPDPHGASYRAQTETFVRGQPLNVTDLDFGPDGAMYVVTGGRKTQSALYRIRYVGTKTPSNIESKQRRERELWSTRARESRRILEAFHRPDPDAVTSAWKWLGHADPALRYAARIAIEHQRIDEWRERALSETHTLTALTAWLALARHGDTDIFGDILKRLNRSDLTKLDPTPLLIALRVYDLCLESNSIDSKLRAECRTSLGRIFPVRTSPSVTPIGWATSTTLELSRLLTLLEDATATQKNVSRMRNSTDTNERLHYLLNLRTTNQGWTTESRRDWFMTLNEATRLPGGRGLPGFLNRIREDAIATLTDAEKKDLGDLLKPTSDESVEPLPQREFVNDWKIDDLTDSLNKVSGGRDFGNGQRMFQQAVCGRCHRVGVNGSAFGPDLTSVGARFSPRDILQSIIDPSAVIAEPYRSVDIVTVDGLSRNGQVVTGGDYRGRSIRLIPDPLHPSKTIEIQKRDIEEHRVSPTSPMPSSLLNTLRRDDILDLLAFLISGGNQQHPAFTK